jgi:MoaA/NifB/PqqE/SkfB family radical SAM enzyme
MLLPVSNNRQDVLLGRSLDSIAIQLTKKCNLSCKMCKFWKQRDKDIPYEKVLSLLDEAYELGARRFDPYGTELFMRDDMPDILAYADWIGFREIYVVSNGLLLNRPELLDKLAMIKSLVIIVSIDGPKDIHDGLRGDGVYDRAVSSLRELGQRRIKRSIASIIMRPTIDSLHEIVDLAADMKIDVISTQPFCRDMADPDCDYEKYEFKPDEKQTVAKELKNLLKYAKQKKVIIYTGNIMKHVADYFAEGIKPLPPHGCHVPLKTLVVDIQGNSYPCFSIFKNMGNVNEVSLSSIRHSDIYRKLAISALEKKCPGCLLACSDVEGYNKRWLESTLLAFRPVRFIKNVFIHKIMTLMQMDTKC